MLGTLDMAVVHDPEQNQAIDGLVARDLATEAKEFLIPEENVRIALGYFDKWQVEVLPVVSSTAGLQVIGDLTEAYALRRYNQELERRRNAELGERDLFSIGEPRR